MRRYRVGIIGCGPRASEHAEALRHMPEVDLVGAADLQPERLNEFCQRWEIEGRYGTSTRLLQEHKLDLVTIVTLPEPHLALVEECAAAGVPVINCEKPIAYDVASADAILAACMRAGSLFTINQQMRYMPQFQAVRKLIKNGRLGDLRFIRVGSKGHLFEQGCHVVDQMLFMNDEQPAEWILGSSDGVEGYDRQHGAPSTSVATMQFKNGVRGSLECGMLAPADDPTGGFWFQKFIEVTGTKGWAGAYVNSGWRALLDTGEVLSGPGCWDPNWPYQAAFFRAALDWIDDRSQVHLCRGEIALKGLEILLGICQSSIDRAAVFPPLDRDRKPREELKPLLSAGHGLV
jgi:predicted dehydrogenase